MLLMVNTRPRAGETREQLIEHLTRRLDPSTWDLIRHTACNPRFYTRWEMNWASLRLVRAPRNAAPTTGAQVRSPSALAHPSKNVWNRQEQTSASAVPMSQKDPKRTSRHCEPMIATLRCQWPIAAPTLARIQATPTWPMHI